MKEFIAVDLGNEGEYLFNDQKLNNKEKKRRGNVV